ncbi:MAG TPA: hypothetical protein VG433_12160, partial [Pirellulales bacterium]|nr:hypothetical protein [Pirellulales bacterium]
MSLTQPPADRQPALDERAAGPGRGLLKALAGVGLAAATYVVMASIVWAGDAAATAWGLAPLKFVGLAVDIALLVWLGVVLARRRHPASGAIGPLVALLATALLFAVADWLINGDRASFW